jgi:hypothetical protein
MEENTTPAPPPKKRKRVPNMKQKLASAHKKLNRIEILIKELKEIIVDFEENQVKIESFKKVMKEM